MFYQLTCSYLPYNKTVILVYCQPPVTGESLCILVCAFLLDNNLIEEPACTSVFAVMANANLGELFQCHSFECEDINLEKQITTR